MVCPASSCLQAEFFKDFVRKLRPRASRMRNVLLLFALRPSPSPAELNACFNLVKALRRMVTMKVTVRYRCVRAAGWCFAATATLGLPPESTNYLHRSFSTHQLAMIIRSCVDSAAIMSGVYPDAWFSRGYEGRRGQAAPLWARTATGGDGTQVASRPRDVARAPTVTDAPNGRLLRELPAWHGAFAFE